MQLKILGLYICIIWTLYIQCCNSWPAIVSESKASHYQDNLLMQWWIFHGNIITKSKRWHFHLNLRQCKFIIWSTLKISREGIGILYLIGIIAFLSQLFGGKCGFVTFLAISNHTVTEFCPPHVLLTAITDDNDQSRQSEFYSQQNKMLGYSYITPLSLLKIILYNGSLKSENVQEGDILVKASGNFCSCWGYTKHSIQKDTNSSHKFLLPS